uniref:Protein gar2-like n=1 Tax=Nicotiana tabacum TaxID=4097 RepID=A0A1S4CNY5_TOBAC|nr:PREDICTED: protein gar2-like [Nicotiana tabacum]
MPKASQTPSKAKSLTKAEAKPKILKSKSKKNAKPLREPTPTPALSHSISSTIPTSSSHVPTIHVVPIIPTSTVTRPSKSTTHAPELPAKNKSKSTKGESVSVTTDQAPHPTSKLDVLVSAIDVAPLDTLPPTSEKPPVEKFPVEKGAWDLGKEIDPTTVEHVVEGEGRKEPVQKEASDGLDFSWTEEEEDDEASEEEKRENKGVSGDEKESDIEDKTGEQANDSTEEENQSEEEEVSESEGEDQEKVSESEGGDEECEEEDVNVSEEFEGSMTIGNTIIALLEEIGEEIRAQEPGSLLTPFTGDEEVSSDEDDMLLSEVGKKSRKTTMKAAKSAVSTRK